MRKMTMLMTMSIKMKEMKDDGTYLHNPVVDVVSPPPLHLVVGRSSCSENRIILVENDFET